MKEFEKIILNESLKTGLRRDQNNPRNQEALVEFHNIEPTKSGPRIHEQLTSLNASGTTWGGLGSKAASTETRTITINVQDYITDTNLETVAVYIDGVSKGNTNVNGELSVADVTVGGHVLRLTKATYLDSDADDLLNDYFVVA